MYLQIKGIDMEAKENIELTLSPAPSYADSSTAVMTQNGAEDPSIAIGTPEVVETPKKTISVSAQSISTTNYSSNPDEIATFDIIFNVSIDCDGCYKTYQIVKRIGVNKTKLAAEVENVRSVSVVESKVEKKTEPSLVEQLRTLAGL